MSCVACSGSPEQISLAYVPFAKDRGIETNSMVVSVNARDMRSALGPKVSASINILGIETQSINNDQPIDDFVEESIASELSARGFVVADGGALIEITVESFYNNFQRGTDNGTALSQAGFHVVVRGRSGERYFADYYGGRASRPVRLVNGSNAKAALELAFYDAASKLASDHDFFGALVDAANETP